MKKNWLHIFLAALLLCLLMAASPAMASKTTEKAKTKCDNCLKITDFIIIGYIPTPISSKPDPVAHWAEAKCKTCGNIQQFVLDDNRRFHTGGDETPTCTTGKTCSLCGGDYGKLGHDWGEWTPNGNGTHSHACKRDGCDATETENCSGDSSASCVTQGTCTSCGGAYYGTHYFGRPWTYGQDETSHWRACKYCDEGKEAVDAHFYVESREDQYLASKATCVSPAIYYKSCTICRRTGTETFKDPWGETDQKNHDLMHFAAKAPTCTKSGWNEYDE